VIILKEIKVGSLLRINQREYIVFGDETDKSYAVMDLETKEIIIHAPTLEGISEFFKKVGNGEFDEIIDPEEFRIEVVLK
jgi:hypothetical protein